MKDLLEKLDLVEFFAYLCPGIIVLSSIILWTPNLAAVFGEELAKHEVLVIIILLVISYAFGVMIASWSGAGADYYVRTYNNEQKQPTGWRRPVWWVILLFHWLPVPQSGRALVEKQLQIFESLEQHTGLQGLPILQNPWERLATYRILVSGKVGDKGRPILTEAEWVHRRLLFALGVALALLLLSLQTILRLLLLGLHKLKLFALGPEDFIAWVNSLPAINLLTLLILAAFSLAASFGMRRIAARWWQYELLLTCSLIHLDSN